jgi:hypothetical protein
LGRGASILVARALLATTSTGNPPKSTRAAKILQQISGRWEEESANLEVRATFLAGRQVYPKGD